MLPAGLAALHDLRSRPYADVGDGTYFSWNPSSGCESSPEFCSTSPTARLGPRGRRWPRECSRPTPQTAVSWRLPRRSATLVSKCWSMRPALFRQLRSPGPMCSSCHTAQAMNGRRRRDKERQRIPLRKSPRSRNLFAEVADWYSWRRRSSPNTAIRLLLSLPDSESGSRARPCRTPSTGSAMFPPGSFSIRRPPHRPATDPRPTYSPECRTHASTGQARCPLMSEPAG